MPTPVSATSITTDVPSSSGGADPDLPVSCMAGSIACQVAHRVLEQVTVARDRQVGRALENEFHVLAGTRAHEPPPPSAREARSPRDAEPPRASGPEPAPATMPSSRFKRPDSRWMWPMNRSRFSGSSRAPACRRSTALAIAASGVRNSWEAFATNSRSARRRRSRSDTSCNTSKHRLRTSRRHPGDLEHVLAV